MKQKRKQAVQKITEIFLQKHNMNDIEYKNNELTGMMLQSLTFLG